MVTSFVNHLVGFTHYYFNVIADCTIKNEIDPYTKEHIIETNFIDFPGGTYQFIKENGNCMLWVQFVSNTAFSIPKNEVFYFKFKDKSTLKLNCSKVSMPDYNSKGFTNSFIFTLTPENLSVLSSKKIDGIKCYIITIEIGNMDASEFKDNLTCLIKEK